MSLKKNVVKLFEVVRKNSGPICKNYKMRLRAEKNKLELYLISQAGHILVRDLTGICPDEILYPNEITKIIRLDSPPCAADLKVGLINIENLSTKLFGE